ncbi:MAG: DUF1997 domain-containing protein [Drouetiella hepatica Uher 2000/2452]|jgi:hypothetical protein|uniref:DUF1997 domain-containing protein n=1 Tax=Drouetiella hepatica Uher 2000/2452 TaxID=904376 RepID=A0A951QAR6_9CYAN|nr:DUF1997 domain-containing protein [Drouetiella hepatica Uher 2000/2452]
MQANSAEYYSSDAQTTHSLILGATSEHVEGSLEKAQSGEVSCFHGAFESCMEMYADAAAVARYLDAHREWFPRCAHPMKAELIGDNGYALTIGKFGSFGYEVEPKVGLNLLPQDQGIYRIQTIAVPGYEPPGYDVDFRAALQLVEIASDASQNAGTPERITRIEWELDLNVMIQFPRFIHALPQPLIQTTGDRLLNQIVRQVSRCLTHKVQEDFHSSLEVTFPKKRRNLWNRNQAG